MVVSSTIAVAALTQFAVEPFGERHGRRRVILSSCVLFVLGALVMAAAMDVWVLIAGRVIVGVGVGLASHTGEYTHTLTHTHKYTHAPTQCTMDRNAVDC